MSKICWYNVILAIKLQNHCQRNLCWFTSTKCECISMTHSWKFAFCYEYMHQQLHTEVLLSWPCSLLISSSSWDLSRASFMAFSVLSLSVCTLCSYCCLSFCQVQNSHFNKNFKYLIFFISLNSKSRLLNKYKSLKWRRTMLKFWSNIFIFLSLLFLKSYLCQF